MNRRDIDPSTGTRGALSGLLGRRSLLRGAVGGLGALALPSLSCAVTPPTPQSTPITVAVLTYNIMTSTKKWVSGMPSRYNDDLVWEVRAPVVVAKAHARDPDVICLQENEGMPASGVKQVTYILQESPGYAVPPTADPGDTLQILYRTSLFRFLDGGAFRINTQGLNGAPKDRWCVWVKLAHRDTDRVLYVFNVHLTSSANLVRARLRSYEWDQLLEGMERINPGMAESYVLAGDFNARQDETRDVFSDHLVKMAAAGIVDSHAVAAQNTTLVPGAQSFNMMGAEIDGTWRYGAIRTEDFHLDYICSSATTVVEEWQDVLGTGADQGVRWLDIEDEAHPFYAEGPIGSDHDPVFARLTFP